MSSWLKGISGDIVINNIDLGTGTVGTLDLGSDDSVRWSSTTDPTGTKVAHLAYSGGPVLAGIGPSTDAAPVGPIVRGGDAWPGATVNTTGANTILAGGIGKRIFTVVAYNQGTMALSTVTVTVNGTATVLTEGTGWHSITSNNATATSLAAAIDALSGVSAVAVSAVVRITPDVGTYSLTIAKTADDAGMTATSGTDGIIGLNALPVCATSWPAIALGPNSDSPALWGGASNLYVSNKSAVTNWVSINSGNIWIRNSGGGLYLAAGDVGWTATGSVISAIGGGVSGNGTVIASSAITAVGTAAANGYIRTGVYKRAWTNAEVTAFGAVLSGDLKVATLPAKTIVRNAYLIIDSQASGTTTLTASLGRTSTAYIDYIVASNAQVAANTVYGDVRSVTDQFTYSFFDLATDLPATLDVPSIYVNRAGAKIITEVYCEADTADGAVINLTNAGDTVLSSDLTCTTAGAASASFVSGKNAVALNAKVSHVTASVLAGLRRLNVVVKYTNVSGEGGPNLNGYDLASSTASTDVYLQFVATGANLDQVTGSTGTVYLLTETVP